jgi:hypothetical protein
MDSCKIMGKKIISCGDKDLPKVIFENVDEVEELGHMRNGFCDRVINLEMNYTSNERVECFIKEFAFDFDNEEKSEDKIMTRYDDRKNKEILEHEEQTNRQRNEDERSERYVNDKAVSNLNIARRC